MGTGRPRGSADENAGTLAHIAPGATETLFTVHLNLYGTLEEHQKAIREFADKHPELEVIQGAGFMPSDELTADMLEGLTDRPIVLADIGHHSYWVNHAALDRQIRCH